MHDYGSFEKVVKQGIRCRGTMSRLQRNQEMWFFTPVRVLRFIMTQIPGILPVWENPGCHERGFTGSFGWWKCYSNIFAWKIRIKKEIRLWAIIFVNWMKRLRKYMFVTGTAMGLWLPGIYIQRVGWYGKPGNQRRKTRGYPLVYDIFLYLCFYQTERIFLLTQWGSIRTILITGENPVAGTAPKIPNPFDTKMYQPEYNRTLPMFPKRLKWCNEQNPECKTVVS